MERSFSDVAGRPPWMLVSEVINRVLWLDPDTLARLGEMDGRVVAIELGDAGAALMTIYLLPTASGLQLRDEIDREPDVTISGHLPVFARLLMGTRRLYPSPGVGLNIRGDLQLGQRFQRVLERIDIDWEEHAARVIGDIAAHRLGNATRAARAWAQDAGETLISDAQEYLKEESRLLARREQVERFLRDVDRLRADVDRLESRIHRLSDQRT